MFHIVVTEEGLFQIVRNSPTPHGTPRVIATSRHEADAKMIVLALNRDPGITVQEAFSRQLWAIRGS